MTEPSVPPGAGKSPVPVGVAAAEADPSAVGGIYVPEAAGETDAAAQLSDATCIVVEAITMGRRSCHITESTSIPVWKVILSDRY